MRRLLTDAMLGRLTTYLRMCGYDTEYVLEEGLEADEEIRAYAAAEERVLVTRDRALADRTADAVLLESREIEPMLSTLRAAGFELSMPETPDRCSACNGTVERVPPDAPVPEYAPDPVETRVWRCRACGQHFWKGSHWEDVAETLS